MGYLLICEIRSRTSCVHEATFRLSGNGSRNSRYMTCAGARSVRLVMITITIPVRSFAIFAFTFHYFLNFTIEVWPTLLSTFVWFTFTRVMLSVMRYLLYCSFQLLQSYNEATEECPVDGVGNGPWHFPHSICCVIPFQPPHSDRGVSR
jgi:hypothetical protein